MGKTCTRCNAYLSLKVPVRAKRARGTYCSIKCADGADLECLKSTVKMSKFDIELYEELVSKGREKTSKFVHTTDVDAQKGLLLQTVMNMFRTGSILETDLLIIEKCIKGLKKHVEIN